LVKLHQDVLHDGLAAQDLPFNTSPDNDLS